MLEREADPGGEARAFDALGRRDGQGVYRVQERKPQPPAGCRMPPVRRLTGHIHTPGVAQTKHSKFRRKQEEERPDRQPQLEVPVRGGVPRKAMLDKTSHRARATDVRRFVKRIRAPDPFCRYARRKRGPQGHVGREVDARLGMTLTER